MDQLREKLAIKGIYPAPTERVLYRYKLKDILIDFIHMNKPILDQRTRG